MKNYYCLILLIIVFFACTKKKPEYRSIAYSEDSLSVYLSKANDFTSYPQKRQDYIRKAADIIADQPNDSIHRVNLFRVANRYFNISNWNAYKETVSQVLEQSEISKDTVSVAKAYTYLGDYYGGQSVSDTAFIYYFKAEKIYLKLNDNFNLAQTRLSKATLQYNESDYLGSEISVFKALSALKGIKENDELYDAYNLLGLVYNELGEYDKAIEFLKKSIVIIDNKTTPVEFQSKATTLNNMGLVYQNLNRNDIAVSYFENGLKHKKELILYRPIIYAMLLDNLAYSRFKLQRDDDIPELFYKSLRLRDSLKLTNGIIITKVHLSEYYQSKKDFIKASQFANEALVTARNSKNHRNMLLPLKQLSIINPKKASIYNKEYIHINDSLQKAERKMGDKFTRIEYETNEIKQENTYLTAQNRNLIYIFGSILILGLFLYIVKAQKAKERTLLHKQEQQRANEEIYNLMISQHNNVELIRRNEKRRVAQELHDGVLGRMFGVRMNLDSLNKIYDESASNQRTSYLAELKNIEQDIRGISHDLSREKSELINNFVAIVNQLFEGQRKMFRTKLFSKIDSAIEWEQMSNAVKINLYRIVQESLQNTNKYAKAENISIEFKKEGQNVFLEIKDDGIGFDTNRAKKGIGLQNMLSRINECNGTFEITSQKGEGTIIRATVPI